MYNMTVGLYIHNSIEYEKYRRKISPILREHDGNFKLDFWVIPLREDKKINRLFIIQFPNKKMMKKFFSDERYLRAKAAHFETSVSETIIYQRYFYEKKHQNE
ncbi:hypothetical protein HMF8227_02543 [Saliniradius amylolyticus]|uniref:DUF1330 domain-containing protein n=1 Tax=Saliniradius amylolyticus TaxID=2183582 RepID=A0A2S2E5R3_9ALTE|nr:DUF1330 domain-containing protein [Saliniradius amylolyticus]AWL12995.1 hypothetical protein HMF8227_02543 [Saliniradius amylolyticus]